MDGPVPLATPNPGKPLPSDRRSRRTRVATGVAVIAIVAVVAMAITWATTSSGSSSASSSSSSQSSSTAPIIHDTNSSVVAADGGIPLASRRRSIVVLGDSCTQYGGYDQGWEVLLHGNYVRSLDTINRGLSGYNTRVYLQHALPGILAEMKSYYNPAVVVMWFGVNDATLINGPNRAQHIPLDEYKKNLIAMIQQIREAAPDAKVLFLSPGYIDETQRIASLVRGGYKATDPLDRNNNQTSLYAHACGVVKNSTFASDDNVVYFDVYDHFATKYPTDENRTTILKDGIHFTPTGDRIFYELVKAQIETALPKDELNKLQFPDDHEYIHYD